jgi:hypothetical protein
LIAYYSALAGVDALWYFKINEHQYNRTSRTVGKFLISDMANAINLVLESRNRNDETDS